MIWAAQLEQHCETFRAVWRARGPEYLKVDIAIDVAIAGTVMAFVPQIQGKLDPFQVTTKMIALEAAERTAEVGGKKAGEVIASTVEQGDEIRNDAVRAKNRLEREFFELTTDVTDLRGRLGEVRPEIVIGGRFDRTFSTRRTCRTARPTASTGAPSWRNRLLHGNRTGTGG